MSGDNAYELGFLEEIIAVNFAGGDWFGISLSLLATGPTFTGPGTGVISFPGISGGTPGITTQTNIDDVGHVDFISYAHKPPFTTTKASLKETHKTDGGLKITGFAVKQIDAFAGLLYMFSADQFQNIFKVRASFTGHLDPAQQFATGFWIQHNKMKAGLTVTASWFDFPFGDFDDNVAMSSGAVDFTFNKKDLTVSGI